MSSLEKHSANSLGSFGVWWSNLLGIFRVPSSSLFSLQMLIILLISMLVLSLEGGREKIHETQISQFYLFEDSKNDKIINKEMVMLFSYYFSDYITYVMYLNYSPMTNTNHLLAFFFVYLISYISDSIILNLSLQHTNTILDNANIIRASPFAFSFDKYMQRQDYSYSRRKTD